MCDFYGVVGRKTSSSEEDLEFRQGILDILVPLLGHKSKLVQEHAYLALSNYSYEEITAVLQPSEEFFPWAFESNINSTKGLISKLIEMECNAMGRAIFKGVGGSIKSSASDDSSMFAKKLAADILDNWSKVTGGCRNSHAGNCT
jgi:hypothetical protein